jgi:hypothetical protein
MRADERFLVFQGGREYEHVVRRSAVAEDDRSVASEPAKSCALHRRAFG